MIEMTLGRNDGTAMPSERGVSAILGLVLLIGMVTTVSVGILLVAEDRMIDAEQQAENKHVEHSFVELSQAMTTTAQTHDTTELSLNSGKHGAVVMTNTSTMTVEGGNISETIHLGTIEYEGDDGTRIAYQGGAVFRETMNKTQVVSAPPLYYEDKTFTFPIVEVANRENRLSGEVTVKYDDTPLTGNTEPIENDVVKIHIESPYYLGWKEYFEQQAGRNAIQDYGRINSTHGFVEVHLGIEEIDTDFSRVVYAGGGDISGHCPSGDAIQGGPVAASGSVNCAEEEGNYESLPDINPIIKSKINSDESYDSPSGKTRLDNGETYYADSGFNVDGNDLTVNLDDGDVTVIVDGDIKIRNDININGDSDNSLKIYSTGNLSVIGSNVDTGGKPSQMQIYGTSEMLVGIIQSDFEGVVYAPRSRAAWNGGQNPTTEDGPGGHSCEVDVCVGGGTGGSGVYGSIIGGPLKVSTGGAGGVPGGHSAIQYDPELNNLEPELSDGEVHPPELTYLNIIKHEVKVENS